MTYILKVYSLIFVLFFAAILNAADHVNNIDNNNISETIYNKCTRLDNNLIVKAISVLPDPSLITLQALVKETTSRISSTFPIYMVATFELLLRLYLGFNDNPTVMFSIITKLLIADIFLSGVSYIANSPCFETLYLALSSLPDMLFPVFIHYSIFAMLLGIPLLSGSNISFLFVALSCYYIVKHNLQTRFDSLDNLSAYQNNLGYNPHVLTIDKILQQKQNVFLYNDAVVNEKTDGIAEKFYKWILVHKNDIPLQELDNITGELIDEHYKKNNNIGNNWLEKANSYSVSKNNKYFIYKESNLKFTLLHKNDDLNEEFFKKSLKKNSIMVLEAIEDHYKSSQYKYQYMGIINNNDKYYLFIGIQMRNKQPSKLHERIINKALEYVSLSNVSIGNAALIVKFNSEEQILAMIKNLIGCFKNCNKKASIYNVVSSNSS